MVEKEKEKLYTDFILNLLKDFQLIYARIDEFEKDPHKYNGDNNDAPKKVTNEEVNGNDALTSKVNDLEKLIKTQQKQNINILKRINNLEKKILSGETSTSSEFSSTLHSNQGKEGEESLSKLELTLKHMKRNMQQGIDEMECSLTGKDYHPPSAKEEKHSSSAAQASANWNASSSSSSRRNEESIWKENGEKKRKYDNEPQQSHPGSSIALKNTTFEKPRSDRGSGGCRSQWGRGPSMERDSRRSSSQQAPPLQSQRYNNGHPPQQPQYSNSSSVRDSRSGGRGRGRGRDLTLPAWMTNGQQQS